MTGRDSPMSTPSQSLEVQRTIEMETPVIRSEINRFAATWHPLDRVSFPQVPTERELRTVESDTMPISGYF